MPRSPVLRNSFAVASALAVLAAPGIAAQGGGLPTIPVTAAQDTLPPVRLTGLDVAVLRSPMTLDRIPFAISTLGDEIGRTGRSGAFLEETLHGFPGVHVQNRFNDAVGERITIRGFGARSQFGVRGIRILVDGIPATLPDGQSSLDHLDLGSLGQVEALRGPGSALYGNAAGGVLAFRSRVPPASPLHQEFRWMEGDHGLRRVHSLTSGSALGGGYLVSLARYAFDGFRVRPNATGDESYGEAERDHLNFQISAPTRGGTLRITGNAVQLAAENPGSLNRATIEIGDRRAFIGNINQRTRKDVTQAQLGVAWEGAVAAGRGLDLMAYGIQREVANPIPSAVIDLDRTALGVRAILRSSSPEETGVRPRWALGTELDMQLDDRRNHTNSQGERGTLTLDQSERVLGGAVFVQAMIPLTPVLDVMTGLRYDRIQFRAEDRLAGVGGRPDGSGTRTMDSASPSFGIHLSAHRSFGAWLNVATAFETPTSSELANRQDGVGGFNPELEPQVGVTTEIGARGAIGASVVYEAAYFYTLLHRELIPFEVEDQPGRSYFRNSGRSVRSGVELALEGALTPSLTTRFTLATNDARFKEFVVGDDDFGGNRVPGVGRLRVEGLVRAGQGPWFLEFRGEHNGSVYGNDANDAASLSPNHALFDLRMGANDLEILGTRLSPFIGITNLFDEGYDASIVVNAFGGRYFEPGPGRSVYIGGSWALERE